MLLVDLSTPAGISDCEGLVKEQKKASINFPGAQFTTYFTYITSTKVQTLTAEALSAGSNACSGTLFTCLTSTTVQILTPEEVVLQGRCLSFALGQRQV